MREVRPQGAQPMFRIPKRCLVAQVPSHSLCCERSTVLTTSASHPCTDSHPLVSPRTLSKIQWNCQFLEPRVFSWKYFNSETFQTLFNLCVVQQRVTTFLLPKLFSSFSPSLRLLHIEEKLGTRGVCGNPQLQSWMELDQLPHRSDLLRRQNCWPQPQWTLYLEGSCGMP